MNFRDWLFTEEDISSQIEPFLTDVARQTIASLHKDEDGRLVFSFPNYEEITDKLTQVSRASAPISPKASPATNMQLAAHALNMQLAAHALNEGRPKLPGSEEERKHRHKKGWQTYKALGQLADPQKDLGWTGQQAGTFKRSLTANIKNIAQPLGFLFEAEVFMYLRDIRKFNDMDEGGMGVDNLRKRYMDQISKKMFSTVEQVFQMVRIHAKDMGDQIASRTEKILGCADMIWFTGGEQEVSWGGRTSPADIAVGCSWHHAGERSKVGYSLKFGTETRVSTASLTISTVLKMLGASNREINLAAKKAGQATEVDEWIDIANQAIYDVVVRKYENNPVNFVKLLNVLLTGGKDVFPAARNYASTELGGANWSGHMQADFQTSDRPAIPLRSKKNAKVTVNATKSYVRMTYTVAEGSKSGTTIYLIPNLSSQKINVKVSNLTSSRGTREEV